MRAVVLPRAGAPTVELAEVPPPVPGPGELLVRVHAAGVGIHDSTFLPADAQYPYPIGIEGAGVVESVAGSSAAVAPGDRVAFVSSMQPKGGTWAELAVVSSSALLVPVPPEMSLVDAAAVPVGGNTALRALHGLRASGDDRTLFVAGASGAVGTFAVQIARRRGWRVAGSASARNHDYLRSLGVELVVDYRDPAWPEQVRRWAPSGVTAAIAVQPRTTAGSQSVVRDRGTVVMVTPDDVVPERGISIEMLPFALDVRDELVELLRLIANGDLRLEVEHVYSFDEAPAALAKVQSRRARGKVVLNVMPAM